MANVYHVAVHYPNATKPRIKRVAVAGGDLTADQLSQRFVDRNSFPGASKIDVYETDEVLPDNIRAIIGAATKQGSNIKLKTTPHATVHRENHPDAAKVEKEEKQASSEGEPARPSPKTVKNR